jgi:hypothetical protein
MKIKTIIFYISFLVSSCIDSDSGLTPKLNIDKEKWCADSTGCDNYRNDNDHELYKNQDSLIGLSFELLKTSFLGNENFIMKTDSSISYVYFTECKYAPSRKNDGSLSSELNRDASCMIFIVDKKGIIKELNGVQP